jgi:hypothetical protein
MDIYKQKSRWKIYLALAGILVFLVSLFYSNYLANQLANGERNKALLLFDAYSYLISANSDTTNVDPADFLNKDISFQLDIIANNDDIPIIVTESDGSISFWKNFGEEHDDDLPFIESELEKLKRKGKEPLKLKDDFTDYILYYKNTQTLNLLTFFPIVQLLLLGAFIAFGYYGFSAARKGEQNRVWAGMAKETAHQLGTPISAIIGWIEHLKLTSEDDPEQLEIVGELRNDVTRLELIADRFSKIGSEPVLEQVNILDQLDDIKTYMKRRSPRNITYDFPEKNGAPIYGQINPHLFTWVLENLIRNALDAMGPKGTISARISNDPNFVSIDLTDTGKGIPNNQLKKVFQPGFSTKKRGWGLGLSLAKRIIENYHKGKIFVRQSKPGEGTTFTIRLPKKH